MNGALGWQAHMVERRGEPIAGREYANEYNVQGRGDMVDFLAEAVDASGAVLMHLTSRTRAPWHLGIALPGGRHLGTMVYAFRSAAGGRDIEGERKFQIRYGRESSWHELDHPVGFDPSGVEVTAILGLDLDLGVMLGVDPELHDPLPMGISFEYRQPQVDAALDSTWHVWERMTRTGVRRDARFEGLETVVTFTPDRFVDYLLFEQEAQRLGLPHGLRFRAAQRAATPGGDLRHDLEDLFDLSAEDILEVIRSRKRLTTDVRGGVAEHHLERILWDDPLVASVQPIDEDGQPDFDVELVDGRRGRVECKTCSPEPYKSGDRAGCPRVEIQKTRASKDDPSSRFYEPSQFDWVAACIWPVTDRWEFRFRRSDELSRHEEYPGRIYPYQAVDDGWSETLPTLP